MRQPVECRSNVDADILAALVAAGGEGGEREYVGHGAGLFRWWVMVGGMVARKWGGRKAW